MAYLDENGLEHFWGKIKDRVSSAVAPKADDADVVHKTGDEVVGGQKTFEQPILLKFSQNHTAVRVIAANAANRNDSLDAVGSFSSNNKRLSLIRTYDKDDSDNRLCSLAAVPNSESINGAAIISVILLDVDGNAVPCATAPSTLEYEADGTTPRTNGYDIVTRNWIPKDTRLVHTTGDETINGTKTFGGAVLSKQASAGVGFAYTPYDTYSSRADQLDSVAVFDNNSKRVFLTRTIDKDSNGNRYTNIYTMPASGNMYGSTALTIGLLDVDGAAIGYAQAPNTPKYEADGTTLRTAGTDIVTRDWIPKDTRIVHTTGNETIQGLKTFYSTNNGNTDYIRVKNSNVDISTSSNTSTISNNALLVADKNDRWASTFQNQFGSNGDVLTFITARKWVSNAYAASQLNILRTNSGGVITVNGISSFNPLAAGITLGANATATRWGQIYSSSTTIQTSDERVKRQIASVPDTVLDAWNDINWVQFKMADALEEKGDSARLHNGMIAQQIDSVFKKHNLDASKYGLFCYDEWEKKNSSYDENGQEVSPGYEAGNLYSLRYGEALCMEAAYMRRENARLKARLDALEERLAALEMK